MNDGPLIVQSDRTLLLEIDHQLAQEARIERMSKMTKNLNNIGFKITQDDCIKQSGGEAVARPHIVKALLSYDENLKRMEEIISYDYVGMFYYLLINSILIIALLIFYLKRKEV